VQAAQAKTGFSFSRLEKTVHSSSGKRVGYNFFMAGIVKPGKNIYVSHRATAK
jgi:hypothetical protein